MRELLDALQATVLATMAVVAGQQIFVAVGVLPAMKVVPDEMSVRMHQELLTRRPDRYLKPASIVALFAAAGSLAVIPFVPHDSIALTTVCTALALCAIAAHSFISIHFEFPINHEVETWAHGLVPASYAGLRAAWDARHLARTICTSFAFAITVAAVMVSR